MASASCCLAQLFPRTSLTNNLGSNILRNSSRTPANNLNKLHNKSLKQSPKSVLLKTWFEKFFKILRKNTCAGVSLLSFFFFFKDAGLRVSTFKQHLRNFFWIAKSLNAESWGRLWFFILFVMPWKMLSRRLAVSEFHVF